ncbi:adenylate/guanylate cyclase domain-containing protein [Leptospira alstonii]|uniref:PAS domain S-box protein n=2 Tax=Leptospira alstonii TaxID=28452 RepID=M6CWA7_9LEPT|nr:adenylate/guanylate cyclase domain-containing protein [Leptospira alstonii]EMJ95954.1 PAS domain S-box protein [Leptospira alstonii serovar Sichuan str. 79601]EQA79792.1 PAS domain S-box protein [Leptospira alstonii serovar Pingchang str. 80-412]
MIQDTKITASDVYRILIVEDERIVARDIQGILQGLGYVSVGIATNGEKAIEIARATLPDLILMDIVLRRDYIDGIETAFRLKGLLDVPVIYVTSHSDKATLRRARITDPHGYILKPINVRELQIAIEMGLYRHSMEKRFRENAAWLNTTLSSIGDGVIATDSISKIKFLNPVAEALLGVAEEDVRGYSVNEIMRLYDADGLLVPNLLSDATATGNRKSLAFERVMLSGTDGKSIHVICTVAPIHDIAGIEQGSVLTLRDISALHAKSAELSRRIEGVEHAKRILERYFPENLVDYLVDQRHQTELEGKNVQATMLFCDVRNSTEISELLNPGEFAAFLSELFTGLMDLTYANGGSVNKILGDGLLITFGCPFPEEDDTINCVRFALQMREYLIAFNDNRNAKLKSPVSMGIGISTGIVFAGNIGSPRHMEYTVLGNAVNTASRLEALTKTMGYDILLDSYTARCVSHKIDIKMIGEFQIRGKKEPQEIFFPVGML